MKEGNTTQPDEATLTLWMDGDLKGDALKAVELWAESHPELFAERDAIQAMNATIGEQIPGSVEPPYPDFFNQKILRDIRDDSVISKPEVIGQKGSFWKWFGAPAVAAAMAVCFVLGQQYGTSSNSSNSIANNTSVNSSVYTPDKNVSSNIFQSTENDSTVILLDGLDDIPDDVEIVAINNPAWIGSMMAQL